MGLYRVYKKDEERDTNWVVLAVDTDAAKAFVILHLGGGSTSFTLKDFRVGFLDEFAKGYISVRTKQQYYWGLEGWKSLPLKEVEKIWKRTGKTGVMTEYKP